jgi:hypothetical protein
MKEISDYIYGALAFLKAELLLAFFVVEEASF